MYLEVLNLYKIAVTQYNIIKNRWRQASWLEWLLVIFRCIECFLGIAQLLLLLCNWCCCCLVIEVAWFLPPPAGVIWLSRQAISPHTQAIKSISISLSSAFNFSNLVVNTFERRRNWSPFVRDRCLFFDGLRRCLTPDPKPDHLSVTWRTHARCLYGWMAGGHRLARRYQITISVWTIYFSRSYCAFFSCDATPSYFFRSFHSMLRHLTFFVLFMRYDAILLFSFFSSDATPFCGAIAPVFAALPLGLPRQDALLSWFMLGFVVSMTLRWNAPPPTTVLSDSCQISFVNGSLDCVQPQNTKSLQWKLHLPAAAVLSISTN